MASLNTTYMVNGTSALKVEQASNLVLVAGGKSYSANQMPTCGSLRQSDVRSSRDLPRAARVRDRRVARRVEPLPQPVAATPVLNSDQELAATLGLLGSIAIVVVGYVLLGAIF